MAVTTTAEIASRLSATSALLTIGNADVFSVADAGAVTVGADDLGHDVIFYGATAGQKFWWDEDANGGNLKLTDNVQIQLGTGGDLTLRHDATNSYISNAVGALKIATETSGIAV